MEQVLQRSEEDEMLRMLAVLGMHHEQQHQELMLADIKHLFSQSPLNPSYNSLRLPVSLAPPPMEWRHFNGDLVEIGYQGKEFSYDNESPRHKQYLQPYQMASRLVTNREYLEFIKDGGYDNPRLWFSEGWDWIKTVECRHPLYWRERDTGWHEFTLSGLIPLDLNLPVIHISFYEADAYARWAGGRLPTEAEWENAAAQQQIEGCFADNNRLHPSSAGEATQPAESGGLAQLYGDAWEWTQSSYSPYPGYKMQTDWQQSGKINSSTLVYRQDSARRRSARGGD